MLTVNESEKFSENSNIWNKYWSCINLNGRLLELVGKWKYILSVLSLDMNTNTLCNYLTNNYIVPSRRENGFRLELK